MKPAWKVVAGLLLGLVAFTWMARSTLESSLRHTLEQRASARIHTPVSIGALTLSLFPGQLTLEHIVVDNPPGYRVPAALTVQMVSIQFDWLSLVFDPIVVRELRIDAPTITLEGSPSENNLTALRALLGGPSADTHAPPPASNSDAISHRRIVIHRVAMHEATATLRLHTDTFDTQADGIRLKPVVLDSLADPTQPLPLVTAAPRILDALLQNVMAGLERTLTNLRGSGRS